MDGWLVITTDRFKESYVKLQLTESTSAEAYLPIAKLGQQRSRAGRAKFEPLFPGYVFAHFALAEQLLELRRVHGYRSVLSFGGKPACVDASVIEELRRRERGRGYITLRAPKASLHIHQNVRVIEGPFSGLTGVFVRYMDSAQRVCILLDVLRSAMRLELPLNAVVAEPSTGTVSVRESRPPEALVES
jgi:transcriptional antiterminator RfaH